MTLDGDAVVTNHFDYYNWQDKEYIINSLVVINESKIVLSLYNHLSTIIYTKDVSTGSLSTYETPCGNKVYFKASKNELHALFLGGGRWNYSPALAELNELCQSTGRTCKISNDADLNPIIDFAVLLEGTVFLRNSFVTQSSSLGYCSQEKVVDDAMLSGNPYVSHIAHLPDGVSFVAVEIVKNTTAKKLLVFKNIKNSGKHSIYKAEYIFGVCMI